MNSKIIQQILTLLFLSALHGQAQGQTWSSLFSNPSQAENGSRSYGCKIWDDTVYVSVVLGDSSNHIRSALYKVDMGGNFSGHEIYLIDDEASSNWNNLFSGYNQLSNEIDTSIYLPLNYGDGGWNNENALVRISKDFELDHIVNLTGIAESDHLDFNGVYKSDSTIYIFGSRAEPGYFFDSPNVPNGIVIKTDLHGNVLWKSAFEDCYSVNFLYELSSGEIILNASESPDDGLVSTKLLIKADSDGQELWRLEFGGQYTSPLSAVIETSAGKILSANGWNNTWSSEVGISWWYDTWLQFQLIEHSDADYEIVEDKKYAKTSNTQEVFGIEELDNGNFLAWGTMVDTSGSVHDPVNLILDRPFTRGFLFMLNSQLDSLWLRTYYYPDDDDFYECYSTFQITDVSFVQSGGFLACGWGAINGLNDLEKVWLMRLDEHGCLEPGCHTVAVDEIVVGFENSMLVFPNPVRDFCTLAWSLEEGRTIEKNFNSTELVVTDTQGREVYRSPIPNFGQNYQMQLDVSSFSSGLYYAHWVSGSTWLDTVSIMVE